MNNTTIQEKLQKQLNKARGDVNQLEKQKQELELQLARARGIVSGLQDAWDIARAEVAP